MVQLFFKIAQFGGGQKDKILAHKADYLVQVIVIQRGRALLRRQKRLHLLHQIAAVVAGQLRVEAGHAQPALADERQHGLKLLRTRPDGKHAVG